MLTADGRRGTDVRCDGTEGVDVDDEIADLFATGAMSGSDGLAAPERLETDRRDRVVLDTVATDHALRLPDLPDVIDRGLATALGLCDQFRRKVDA